MGKEAMKDHARYTFQNAVARGDIIRPLICENGCISDKSLHGHHEDYSKPLDVIWLCTSCHGKRHVEINAMEPLPLGEYLMRNNMSTGQLAIKINTKRQTLDNWLVDENQECRETIIQYDVGTGHIEKVTTMKFKVVYERPE